MKFYGFAPNKFSTSIQMEKLFIFDEITGEIKLNVHKFEKAKFISSNIKWCPF